MHVIIRKGVDKFWENMLNFGLGSSSPIIAMFLSKRYTHYIVQVLELTAMILVKRYAATFVTEYIGISDTLARKADE